LARKGCRGKKGRRGSAGGRRLGRRGSDHRTLVFREMFSNGLSVGKASKDALDADDEIRGKLQPVGGRKVGESFSSGLENIRNAGVFVDDSATILSGTPKSRLQKQIVRKEDGK